jgi:hypothetical protein
MFCCMPCMMPFVKTVSSTGWSVAVSLLIPDQHLLIVSDLITVNSQWVLNSFTSAMLDSAHCTSKASRYIRLLHARLHTHATLC